MIRSVLVWSSAMLLTLFYVPPVIAMSVLDRSGRAAHTLCRAWARGVLWLAGAEVSVEGGENIDLNEPCLYASNHQSWFDVFTLMAYLPGNARFVAKKSLEYIPFFGFAMRAVGTVIIDRKNPEAARKTLLEGANKQLGGSRKIIIFPEGTRSRDGNLQPFKMGGFVLAIQAGIPVVPVGVAGSRDILPADGYRVKPGNIRIRIGDPIPTSGLTLDDRHKLMEKAHSHVLALLNKEKIAATDMHAAA